MTVITYSVSLWAMTVSCRCSATRCSPKYSQEKTVLLARPTGPINRQPKNCSEGRFDLDHRACFSHARVDPVGADEPLIGSARLVPSFNRLKKACRLAVSRSRLKPTEFPIEIGKKKKKRIPFGRGRMCHFSRALVEKPTFFLILARFDQLLKSKGMGVLTYLIPAVYIFSFSWLPFFSALC